MKGLTALAIVIGIALIFSLVSIYSEVGYTRTPCEDACIAGAAACLSRCTAGNTTCPGDCQRDADNCVASCNAPNGCTGATSKSCPGGICVASNAPCPAIPGGAACANRTCPGQTCLAGVCLNTPDPNLPSAVKCTTTANCAKLGPDWICPWGGAVGGTCVKKGEYNRSIIVGRTYDTCNVLLQCNREPDRTTCTKNGVQCTCGTPACTCAPGVQGCTSTTTPGNCRWDQPPAISCTQTNLIEGIDDVEDFQTCLLNMTQRDIIGADVVVFSTGGVQIDSITKGGRDYTISAPPPPYKDRTDIFRQSGAREVTASVTDNGPGDEFVDIAGTKWTTYAAAGLYGGVLVPTIVQKCAIVDGAGFNGATRKPIITALCRGTADECTILEGESASCGSCSQFNGWTDVSSSASCEGTFRTSVTTEGFYTYACGIQNSGEFGAYFGCSGSQTDTRQRTDSRQLCRYGCNNGACKFSRPPTLTSITPTPVKVPKTGSIEVTSIASDPDSISDGSTARREKIQLLCGTSSGSFDCNEVKFNATCSGGSVPRIALSWSATSPPQNNINRRTSTTSFTDFAQPIPGISSSTRLFIDNNVQLGTTYVYAYKPSPSCSKEVTVPVSAGECGGFSTITARVTENPLPITGKAGCNQGVNSCFCEPDNGRVTSLSATPVGASSASCRTNPTPGCKIDLDMFARAANGAVSGRGSITWTCTAGATVAPDPSKPANCAGFTPTITVTGSGGATCTAMHSDGPAFSLNIGGGASTGPPPQNINFTANLCTGEFADSNPKCTISSIPDSWKTGTGNRTIVCRVKDEFGLYSDAKTTQVIVDNNPPESIITSPEAGSEQFGPFTVSVSDVDDSELDKCFFFVTNSSGRSADIVRQCNRPFSITIGPFGKCSDHGSCEISVYATDKSGNIGRPHARNFTIKLFSTNITAPEEGTFFTKNFTVSVEDKNIFNANITPFRCFYDVFNVTNTSARKTVNNRERVCNADINITIGPDGDCNVLGESSCKVVAKINTTTRTGSVFATSERFFSVDWMTPISTIISPPAGWQNADFNLQIQDDPQASIITGCQYRVVSGGTQTVPWTTRECGTLSAASDFLPVLRITVGAGKNCRNEGGNTCTIFVRPLGRNGEIGIGANITLAIIIDGNVTNTDGFNPISSIVTRRGINFSGTLRDTELSLSTFYVCNAGSTVRACIDAFNAANRGQGKPNLCGELMTGLTGRCELRCNDASVQYYLAARGLPPPPSPAQSVIVVSRLQSATCPSFSIDQINNFLSIFREKEQDISIAIMLTDALIQQDGSTPELEQRLVMYNEALLLTRDHLNYMTNAMNNLDTVVAAQIIARSITRLAEIDELLRRITSPTILELSVSVPGVVRFNGAGVLAAFVEKAGPNQAFGKIYCSITKPGASPVRNSTSCINFTGSNSLDISFNADRIGTWSYSCTMGRSVRSDCSFEVNSTPVTGTFQVLPGLLAFIQSVTAPATATIKQIVAVNAAVINPDDRDKFATVRCDFTDPQGFLTRNSSSCMRIPANGTNSGTMLMNVGDRRGTWTVNRCTLFASTSDTCTGTVIENVSAETDQFIVTLPTDVYIESVTKPPQLNNGTQGQLTAVVINPTDFPAFVEFTCNIASPTSNFSLSSRRPLDLQKSAVFNFTIDADTVGIWTVNNCTTDKSLTSDFANLNRTYVYPNIGTFEVVQGTRLFFLSSSLPSGANVGTNASINLVIKNPSTQRFGQVSCQYRNPLNTPLTALSQCFQINQNAQMTVPVGVPIDRAGTWLVDSCTVSGSLSPDCSGLTIHNTLPSVGSFISQLIVALTTVSPPDLYIESFDTPALVFNNTIATLTVTVRNNNTVNTTFATAGCTVTNPSGVMSTFLGACKQLGANSSGVFSAQQLFNIAGTWALNGCFVNGSAISSCSPSFLYNVSPASKTTLVRIPGDLFVSRVNAPDVDPVNNTNVRIDVTVTNTIVDDRFGFVSCQIADPNNAVQTKTTPCTPVPARTSKIFNVSVFGNVVGRWTATNCSAFASTSSSCAGAAPTGELINGDGFNVIRGSNLLFFALSVNEPVFSNVNTTASFSISNPSTADRFAKVRCTATKLGASVTSSTSCFIVPSQTFQNSDVPVRVNSAGTWALACSLERSLDPTCAGASVDDTRITSFVAADPAVVFNPPLLYIDGVNTASSAFNNSAIETTVSVRNNNTEDPVFTMAGCTMTTPLGVPIRIRSGCTQISPNTSAPFTMQQLMNIPGIWTLSGCFTNGSTSPTCSPSQTYNVSPITKNINIALPGALFISRVRAPTTDIANNTNARIDVTVDNTIDDDRFGIVSCKFADPAGGLQTLSTACMAVPTRTSRTFNVSVFATVVGRWNVANCSVLASTSSSCVGGNPTGEMINGDGFNVIRGSNLLFSSLSITQPVFVGTNAVISYTIINPSIADRFARVRCTATKLGATVSSSTACLGIQGSSFFSSSFNLSPPSAGTWSLICNAERSFDSGCTLPTVDDSRTINFDAANPVVVSTPVNLYINGVNTASSAFNNSLIETTISVRNNNTVDPIYAFAGCTVTNPFGVPAGAVSSCAQIGPNTSVTFPTQQLLNIPGTWTVSGCFVNGSTSPTCSSSQTYNVSPISRNINVALPGALFVSQVSAPNNDIANNTDVRIDVTVTNTIVDDRFGFVSCQIADPTGAIQTRPTPCTPVPAGTSRLFNFSVFGNVVGRWTVANCTVLASTSSSCAGAAPTGELINGDGFNVIRGSNLLFSTLSVAQPVFLGTSAVISYTISNPSTADRFSRVRCTATSGAVSVTNSTNCIGVQGSSFLTSSVTIAPPFTGTWALACSVERSLDSVCSTPVTDDTRSTTFDVSASAVVPTPLLLYISGVNTASSAFNNSLIEISTIVRNNNTVTTAFAISGCTVINPAGTVSRVISACTQVGANASATLTMQQLLNMPGIWTVNNCFVNGTTSPSCSNSQLYNVSPVSRTIPVAIPGSLFVSRVSPPNSDVLNNTNVGIDVTVDNTIPDDRFGFVSCQIADPRGAIQTRATACTPVPARTSRLFNVSVFANVVGRWTVANCTVLASTSSSCSGANPTGELINGDGFTVIKGYNLLFSSLSIGQPVYIGSDALVSFTLSNPSTAERFARVRCTTTRSGVSITNSTPCFGMAGESFFSSMLSVHPLSVGTWSLSCTAERSFDASCSSPFIDETRTNNYDVVNPQDLFIQSVAVPAVVPKDRSFDTIITVRNPNLQRTYAFVGCTFKNNLSEEQINTSTCDSAFIDTNTFVVRFTPAFKGRWDVYGCYVRTSPNSDCSSSRVNNVSTERDTFTASQPILTIESISVTPQGPHVGDLLDINVGVRNNDEIDHGAFVNCTIVNPNGLRYKLTTPVVTLQFGELRAFHPQRAIDVAGTWLIESCSAFRKDSPPVLEDQVNYNQTFSATTPPPVDLCSSDSPCPQGFTCDNGKCVEQTTPACSLANCPGIKNACYCLGDRCVPCPQGYTCANNRCVSETSVATACGDDTDCTSGKKCVGGVCTQTEECFLSSDCGSGLICQSGKCIVPAAGVSNDLVNIIIIILAAISVPAILFIYIKRVI